MHHYKYTFSTSSCPTPSTSNALGPSSNSAPIKGAPGAKGRLGEAFRAHVAEKQTAGQSQNQAQVESKPSPAASLRGGGNANCAGDTDIWEDDENRRISRRREQRSPRRSRPGIRQETFISGGRVFASDGNVEHRPTRPGRPAQRPTSQPRQPRPGQ